MVKRAPPVVGLRPEQAQAIKEGKDPKLSLSQNLAARQGRLSSTRRIGGTKSRSSISESKRILENIQKANSAAAQAAASKAAAQKALIAKTMAAGRARIAAMERSKRTRLTSLERRSLNAREVLRITAIARGRGFTRLEGQRFIKQRGGSITGLRSATRKGFVIRAPKEMAKQEKKIFLKVDIPTKKFKIPKDLLARIDRERKNKSFQTTQQLNLSLQNFRDTGKINSKILNIADIVTGGAFTETSIDKDQGTLNNRVERFNKKFSGEELSEAEFKKAETEQKFIDSEQSRIDKRRDNLAGSKRDAIRDFFVNLNLQKSPRLTTAESNKIKQDLKNNKQKQSKIKANAPVINKKKTSISNKNKEIKTLQNKETKTFLEDIRLIKLKNQVNVLNSDVAILEFRAPPKILAGTFPIIPATRIPSGISKIGFVGEQRIGTSGKIVTDISFRTKDGVSGVARGVTGQASEDGKTINIIAGRSGKLKINLPTGGKKVTGIQSFVGVEKVVSKSKTLKTIVTLAKNGEITQAKAKKFKTLLNSIFKGDPKKINLKKLKQLQKQISKSKKLKPLDLKKNLQRLKKRGLISVKKSKARASEPGFDKIIKRLKRQAIKAKKKEKNEILKPTSSKKDISLPKEFRPKKLKKKVDTITKTLFVKKIKSFRTNNLITIRQERKLIKRINRLSKRGKIPRSELLKITRKLKQSKPLDISRLPKSLRVKEVKKVKMPKPLDLRKNIATLRKRGFITAKKAKKFRLQLLFRKKKAKGLIDLEKNLKRLRKKGLITKAPKEPIPRASEPGFDKIIKRLKRQAIEAQNKNIPKRIKDNIKILEQTATGQIASIRGKKFIDSTGNIKKGIDLDDFSSVASVLTKKDLSAIIGNTISLKGRKSEFIGLIRGTSKASSSSAGSSSQQQQFKKALNKVLSAVGSASAKAEKGGKLKTLSKTVATSAIISKVPITAARAIIKKPTKTIVKTGTQTKTITRLNTKQKVLQTKITQQKQRVAQLSKQKSRQAVKQKAGQKVKQVVGQKILQRTAQSQKILNRLVLRQKAILKQIARAGGAIPRIPRVPRLVKIPKRKSTTGKVTKKLTKPVQVFDVFGKSRGKFVKLNVKPLTRADALSKGAFAVDRTTAKTFKIAPKGKSKIPGALLKGERNYFKRQGFKLREVRIKKGRKFQLKNKYIEKTKFGIDTSGERSGLSIAKLLQQQRKKRPLKATVRKKNARKVVRQPPKTKRKITPAQRKVLLKRLEKARKVRMKNVRRKK